MQGRIQKWGNSLALRIPKALAREIGLDEDYPVEITLEEGRIIISPGGKPHFTLDELLAGVTDENIHSEINTGPAVGNEVW
jgi:antitoxin MazE